MKKKDILAQMFENPKADWRIEQLIKVAENAGVTVRPPSNGSHYTFSSPYSERILTVPHKRPIKPIYVRRFCALVTNHSAGLEDHNEQ